METFVQMNLANSTFFTIARILFHTSEMFSDGAEMSRHLPSTRTTFDTVVTSMLFMPPAMRALQMSGMTSFSLFIVTSFRDVVAVMAWIELCATRESHSAVPLIMFYWLPRTQTSLFSWKCARKGRREEDNGRDVWQILFSRWRQE